MAINPMQLMKLKGRWDLFRKDHPKFVSFFGAVGAAGLQEGTVLEVKFTSPDGKETVTNMKLNANDLETISMVRSALGRK
ncbi:MAG: hypothetical protein UHN88_08680 [Eubacterium sp.]|nr:hypothetical protein [Eubacterium sp.]